MSQEEKLVGSAVEKLRFINTPLHPECAAQCKHKHGEEDFTRGFIKRTGTERTLDEIRLAHNDDATNLEIFYDLFLACINLFSANQQLTTLKGLSAYCGFFGIIWTTWFMTGMYDVRFLKDSIFERVARGVHLGVLVGFVVVSPNFDTQDQDPLVFKVFTVILMASRLCLAAEYGSVLYHLRDFPGARLPVGCLVAKNFVAAMIYLAVAFRFREGHNSNIFSVWYILAGFEIIAGIYFSYRYRFLSFQGTYIMKRMGLLTCILFGEGVASACGSITKVIKAEDHGDVWTSETIGTVTACIALIYIVYMVYSDWVSKDQLPSWRQMTWVMLHFPLHLVMMLFMEGCAQFIVFWKLAEKSLGAYETLVAKMEEIFLSDKPEDFGQGVRDFVTDFTTKFPPVYTYVYDAIDDGLQAVDNVNITAMVERIRALPNQDDILKDKGIVALENAIQKIGLALENTLYNRYGIDFTEDVVESEGVTEESDLENMQAVVNARSYGRFRVVFQYTFVAAGCFLAVANILSIISRTKRWTWSAAIYHSTIFVLAIAVALVSAVSQNETYLMDYQATPLILPTLLLGYLLIFTMNHVSGRLAANRDKKATREAAANAAMVSQFPSGDSVTFGSNGQQYTPLATDKNTTVAYAAEQTRATDPHTPEERGFAIPRRPVSYSAANYGAQNAV